MRLIGKYYIVYCSYIFMVTMSLFDERCMRRLYNYFLSYEFDDSPSVCVWFQEREFGDVRAGLDSDIRPGYSCRFSKYLSFGDFCDFYNECVLFCGELLERGLYLKVFDSSRYRGRLYFRVSYALGSEYDAVIRSICE